MKRQVICDKGSRSHSIRITKRKGNKQKKTGIRPMRGPSCSGRRRRSYGLENQISRLLPIFPHVPTPLSALRCPRGSSAPALGVIGRRSPRGDLGGCQLNRPCQRGRKAKEAAKGESSGGKVQTKGKGSKGKTGGSGQPRD